MGHVCIPFSMLKCDSCGEPLTDGTPGTHDNSIVCSKCGAENIIIFAAGAGTSTTQKESY